MVRPGWIENCPRSSGRGTGKEGLPFAVLRGPSGSLALSVGLGRPAKEDDHGRFTTLVSSLELVTLGPDDADLAGVAFLARYCGRCGPGSSWPPSTPGCRCETSSSPPATPTHAPPPSTTGAARTSTATPPTSSSPSSPADSTPARHVSGVRRRLRRSVPSGGSGTASGGGCRREHPLRRPVRVPRGGGQDARGRARCDTGRRGRRRSMGQEPAIGSHAATSSRCAWSCS